MHRFFNISVDTTAFPWAERTPWAGLKSIVAVVLALVLGQVTGHPSAGAIAAGSAFIVGFAVFHEALASALLSMTLLTAGVASGTLAGSLGAQWTWVVMLLVLVAAINYGLLSGLSPTTGWMGQQCAVFVIIASYFPRGVHYAVGRASMVLLGGALQILVYSAFHLVRFQRTEAVAPPITARLRFRLTELWSKLRYETRLRSDTRSYTLRLAVTLLLCTALYRYDHVRNGYWSPMTALLVLKPQWSETLSRSIARLAGTLLGAAVAVLLARYVPVPLPIIYALVIVCAWACYALQAVNYAVFSLFITLYVIFLFRVGGFSQTSAAHIRLFNTALGGGIALLMDGIWNLIAPSPPQDSLAQGSTPVRQTTAASL